MKRITAIILVCIMIICIIPVEALAKTTNLNRPLAFEENIAGELKKLNLFKGVSETDFDLGRAPTRIEALVIMLRLMGKEDEILDGTYSHPFTDVPGWADKYVGYAYENKLTNGISSNKFGTSNATDVQFITFVLRAMGYSDAQGEDFTWDKPYELAEKLGILTCAITTGSDFLRADCVSLSYNSLAAKMKDSTNTLADKLITDGVFAKADYEAAKEQVPDYAGMLKAYGIADIRWHKKPGTANDHIENFLYSYIRGAWEFDTNYKGVWHETNLGQWKERLGSNWFGQYFDAYLGEYLNCFDLCVYCDSDGNYKIYTSGAQPAFTKDEMVQHLFDAYDAAMNLYTKFHNTYRNNFSSELELVEKYTVFLKSYLKGKGYKALSTPAEGKHSAESPQTSILSMTGDGVYNLLINNWGDCGPHAALLNVMLNIEGMTTFGVSGMDNGGGHIISGFIADGKTYVCDWFNNRGIFEYNSPEMGTFFTPNEEGRSNMIRYANRNKQIVPEKVLNCISYKSFDSVQKGNSFVLIPKYMLHGFPYSRNYIVPWIGDYENHKKGNAFMFGDNNQTITIKFDQATVDSVQSKNIYLLTTDLSNMIKNGEISFEDAVKPFVDYQAKKMK